MSEVQTVKLNVIVETTHATGAHGGGRLGWGEQLGSDPCWEKGTSGLLVRAPTTVKRMQ